MSTKPPQLPVNLTKFSPTPSSITKQSHTIQQQQQLELNKQRAELIIASILEQVRGAQVATITSIGNDSYE